MGQIGTFFDWLFNKPAGVLCLIVGGIIFFLIVSVSRTTTTSPKQ